MRGDDADAEDEPGIITPDALANDLVRLVGDTRAHDAARSRARERSMRQQATEMATLTGVLLDLAEEDAPVAIRTTWGRSHHGRITSVGRDFVQLRTAGGAEIYVKTGALAVVRRVPGRRAPDTTGARPNLANTSLTAILAGMAPDRPLVSVALDGEPAALTGELRAVGADVATMRLDGVPATFAYVALSALSDVVILASG